MFELQEIFKKYGADYEKIRKLTLNQQKAVYCIKACRTSEMGGHVDACDECGCYQISYNSCRNRHCPKCQTLAKERWINDRKQELLPVQYFHVVFTIPDIINPIAMSNQKAIYSILFKAASETLLELAGDKKYLGAQIGFTSILHTWGQNLMYHPHIHCIVPGGGLTPTSKWISSKKDFFIPVKVLSRKFRGKFLYYLKDSWNESKLVFHGSTENLVLEQDFQSMINKLYSVEWVVYCKEPFKGPECVVEYLGRYTHRVAISNNRILSVENGQITFKWRDYKDNNKEKLMTISVMEFIRRFLLHILPEGFVKIRHHGLLSNRNKSKKIKLCKRLTGAKYNNSCFKKLSVKEIMIELTGRDITKCPHCKSGILRRVRTFSKQGISPPANIRVTA